MMSRVVKRSSRSSSRPASRWRRLALLDRDDDSAIGDGRACRGDRSGHAGRPRRLSRARRQTASAATPRPAARPSRAASRIETPFGIVRAPNLTPDAHGLGRMERRRLLARAAQRPLARRPPALSGVSVPELHAAARADADAMFAYLKPPAGRAGEQAARAALPVRPAGRARGLARALLPAGAASSPTPARSAPWNRGAYLVETLGHCNACHSQRNVFGATVARSISPAA